MVAVLVFRQLFDAATSTYTYLLGDAEAGVALLIDPVFENANRDIALLRELDMSLLATLDTHVHADHITAAWLLQQRCGSRILLSAAAGAANVDRRLAHGDRIEFGSRHLTVRATPGHTRGCLAYVLDDQSLAFTGDSLLIRGCGRTDFQGGSAELLYQSVQQQILSLPPACLLYPAHDYRGLTVTSVNEERRYNPRLGGRVDVSDFVGYMANLGLPHPKAMDLAVPANLRCGQPLERSAAPEEPGWAPLVYTFSGVWEIEPLVLHERLARPAASAANELQVIDVREPAEFDDSLGHIEGARLLPLANVSAPGGGLDRTRPVVTICRSGARSAQATLLLQKAGFSDVANLAGGMLRWHAEGLPVVGGNGQRPPCLN